jgi:tRNA threonylcarbamoyladenosine biosynthesis protein TsaB
VLVLGIETATDRLGLALWRDHRVLAETHLEIGRRHAERLLVSLDGLASDLGISLAELDGVAVSQGPGSFTGLRLGLPSDKGLAVAVGTKLVGVPTLEVLARGAEPWEGPLVACLDARRSEVYFCAYELNTRGARCLDEKIQLGGPGDVAARCRLLGARVLLVGTGALTVRDAVGPEVRVAPRDLCLPRAAHVARLGAECLHRGGGEEPDHVEPIYVRRSDAELRRGTFAGQT